MKTILIFILTVFCFTFVLAQDLYLKKTPKVPKDTLLLVLPNKSIPNYNQLYGTIESQHSLLIKKPAVNTLEIPNVPINDSIDYKILYIRKEDSNLTTK